MPMHKKTITLPDAMEAWIATQTASGRYGSDSEYIRDLIRRDQERHDAIEQLRTLIEEGRASGLSDKTPQQIVAEALSRLKRDDA